MRRQVRRVQEAKPSAPGSGDEAVQAALEQRLWTSPPTKRQEERRGCEGPNSRWPAPRGDQRALRARLALAPRPPKTDESRGPGVTALMSSSRLRGGYPAADGPASYKAAQSSRRNGRNAGCPPAWTAETARLASPRSWPGSAGILLSRRDHASPPASHLTPPKPSTRTHWRSSTPRRACDGRSRAARARRPRSTTSSASPTASRKTATSAIATRTRRPGRRASTWPRSRAASTSSSGSSTRESTKARCRGCVMSPPSPPRASRGCPAFADLGNPLSGRAGRHCPPCRGRSRLCRHPRHVPLALPVHPALGQRARHDAAARRRHERRARCGAAPRRRRERRRRARPRGQLAPSLCGQLGTRPGAFFCAFVRP